MKRDWHSEELTEHWTLTPDEKQQALSKRGPPRLAFAVLLKAFQYQGRFPRSARDVPTPVIDYVAQQLDLTPQLWLEYDWQGRAVKYHRAEIRKLLGFREATVADGQALVHWLCDHCLPHTRRWESIESTAYERLRALRIEPPPPERLARLIRSALHKFDQRFCMTVYQRLSPATRVRLEGLLEPARDATEAAGAVPGAERTALQALRAEAGPATLDTLFEAIAKLQRLRALHLPAGLFAGVSAQVLQAYQQRTAVEEPYELRRHPPALRVTLLAAFCQHRLRVLTDTLVELLIQLIHRIGARA
jgi:Domain of unknown function (DUF4158)